MMVIIYLMIGYAAFLITFALELAFVPDLGFPVSILVAWIVALQVVQVIATIANYRR